MLEVAEVLLAYTDGATEAKDRLGVEFNLEQHAATSLNTTDLHQGLDELLAALQQHSAGRIRDDVVLLALSRQPN